MRNHQINQGASICAASETLRPRGQNRKFARSKLRTFADLRPRGEGLEAGNQQEATGVGLGWGLGQVGRGWGIWGVRGLGVWVGGWAGWGVGVGEAGCGWHVCQESNSDGPFAKYANKLAIPAVQTQKTAHVVRSLVSPSGQPASGLAPSSVWKACSPPDSSRAQTSVARKTQRNLAKKQPKGPFKQKVGNLCTGRWLEPPRAFTFTEFWLETSRPQNALGATCS